MSHPLGVKLERVHSSPMPQVDVDIIAIHGLDTDSTKTWTWTPRDGAPSVNWLSDPFMLPKRVPEADIWVCDWQADLVTSPGQAPKRFEELARDLLATLNAHLRNRSTTSGASRRRILFIASCFGGILLLKTIILSSQGDSQLLEALSGIIFLATPFQGTSFERVVKWATPILDFWANLHHQKPTPLLSLLGATSQEVDTIVRDFTHLWNTSECQIFTFYELGNTNLLNKVKIDIPKFDEPLVNWQSGTLHIVQHPQGLERPHVLMNKFPGPDDGCYRFVSQKIKDFLNNTRGPLSTLQEADNQIIKSYQFDTNRLKIERLSGEILPMQQCYINLTIIERNRSNFATREKPFEDNAQSKNIVKLFDIFKDRNEQEGKGSKPRRVFIHGRPGVGKTTLCKKVVHDHIHHGLWKAHFDRLLWIPLRSLTDREDRYDLSQLFQDEFFSQCQRKCDFAQEMVKKCQESGRERTLFVLDGLDEIWHNISRDGVKYKLLLELLDMPSLIVMTRPSITLTTEIEFDILLETIGFELHQVTQYIQNLEPQNASSIISSLAEKPRLRDLSRVPVQLDALCFAWKGLDDRHRDTITDLYQGIYDAIWQRDAKRFGKEGRETMMLIEKIAFLVLLNGRTSFDHDSLNKMWHDYREGALVNDGHLSKVSFLRTTSATSSHRKLSFYFLHLTFQEYFTARHICGKWLNGQVVAGPERLDAKAFFMKHNYAARYSVVWRFVAGLLSNAGRGKEFFDQMEQEPRDLLGLVHSRLTMHCLNEVPQTPGNQTCIDLRLQVQRQLCRLWANMTGSHRSYLEVACHAEFPEQCLVHIIRSQSSQSRLATIASRLTTASKSSEKHSRPKFSIDVKSKALNSLGMRLLISGSAISESAIEEVARCLGDQEPRIRHAAAKALRNQAILPLSTIKTIVQYLSIPDSQIKYVAVETLGNCPQLPESTIKAIVLCLADQDWSIRYAAANALNRQAILSSPIIKTIVQYLSIPDLQTRHATVVALANCPDLPESTVETMVLYLADQHSGVRSSAVDVLNRQVNLSASVIDAIVQYLSNSDPQIRCAAINSLERHTNLPESAIQPLDRCLRGQNQDVAIAVMKLLKGGTSLPDRSVSHVTWYLNADDGRVRQCAQEALTGLSCLGPYTLNEVFKCLHEGKLLAKVGAVKVLGGRLGQSEQVIEEVVKCLGNELEEICFFAKFSLKFSHPSLSGKIAKVLMRCWDDNDCYFRQNAAVVLSNLSFLPVSTWNALAQCLDDKDSRIRRVAIDALKHRCDIPVWIIEALKQCLDDQDPLVRCAAIEALKRGPELTVSIIEALGQHLGDQDLLVRRAAIDALKYRPDLPEWIISVLSQCLDDQDILVRRAAADALKKRYLSESTTEALAQCLSDQDSFVKRAAIDALGNRPNLPEWIIEALLLCLDDQDIGVKRAALAAFKSRPNLPVSIIEALAQCLGDQDAFVRHAAAATMKSHPCCSQSTVITLCRRKSFHKYLMLGLIHHTAFHQAFLAYHPANFFQALLDGSESSHLSWCIDGSTSQIETEHGKHIAEYSGLGSVLKVVQRQKRKLGMVGSRVE